MFELCPPSIEALRRAPVKFRYGRRRVLVDKLSADAMLLVYAHLNADHQKVVADRVIKDASGLLRFASFSLQRVTLGGKS